MYYTLYQLAWFFLVYSLAGWCVSVAAAAVRRHIFVNSGFLNLPLKPSYGFGAVLFAIFLPELADHPVFLVVGGAVMLYVGSDLKYLTIPSTDACTIFS